MTAWVLIIPSKPQLSNFSDPFFSNLRLKFVPLAERRGGLILCYYY